MTYPSGAGIFQTNTGPTDPNGATSGAAPPFPSPGAPANVADFQTSPATFNSSEGISSTGELIQELALVGGAEPDKVLYNTTPIPALNIAQTTPGAPSGTYVQSGSAYVTNSSAVRLAGVSVQGFAYYTSITNG